MGAPTHEEQADRLETELTDEERELLDRLADGIARRRLAPAAMFFLESMKPMGFVASQALRFFQPIVQMVFSNPNTYEQIAALMERRGAVELLLRRLEARA